MTLGRLRQSIVGGLAINQVVGVCREGSCKFANLGAQTSLFLIDRNNKPIFVIPSSRRRSAAKI